MLSAARLTALLPLVLCIQTAFAAPSNARRSIALEDGNASSSSSSSLVTSRSYAPSASTTSRSASLPSATLAKRATACTTTAQCPKVANAKVGCNTKSKLCVTTCNAGYTLSGTLCTANAAQPAAVTTAAAVKTTTTVAPVPTTTTPPAPVCAPTYAGAATTIRGTGTLPKPTAFVKRSGTSLTVSGRGYRIAGPNIYWLCSDENVNGGAPPDKGRVREALAIAVAMGANTVRLHTCGVSVGPNNPYNLNPSYNNWVAGLWDARDYALYAAREYGLRVIMPLTDNYDFYHGGKYSFLNFVGASIANKGSQFYTNQNAINAYSSYITTFLTHVNAYTGVSYANDPTILAWETGNELGAWQHSEMWPPAAWTTAIANVIRKSDRNHLIIDGTDGFWDPNTGATPDGLRVSTVDIMSDHGYPRSTSILSKELSLAKSAGKAMFVGEWDWTSSHGGSALSDYINMLESGGIGDMMWSLFGHDAQCCAFVQHNDGYSLYYPNGNSAADQANALKVVQHYYRVTGRAVPSKLPAVACPQPAF
ncbi:hypothetical protein JCM8097_001113 [Rhodosporidiobolus ruineniae]